ncbi:MFS transporter [Bacillus sp. T33-2]|uniref:MFS transporter n=1 Tax=Bacillus sp. T33-2 TaxID=2054168 RepID=UPI0015E13883|nr:MFS transporter [Bacillus sp. T33-2]
MIKEASNPIPSSLQFFQTTKTLLAVSWLNTLANSLSNIFVNIFLFKVTEQFGIVVLFNLMMYIAWLPAFVAAGWLGKRTSKRNGLIIGNSFQFVFYLCILLLGEQAGDHVVLLGLLFGVGSGFYWLSINVMSVDYTTNSNRDWFNGVNGMVNSISQMLGPFLAGLFIVNFERLSGYYIIFGCSFVIFFFTILLSLQFPREDGEKKFYWREMLAVHGNREWRALTYAFMANAFRGGVLSFVILVWVFMVTKDESALGAFSLLSTGLTFLMYYMVGKYGKGKRRLKYMLIGNVFLSIALLGLVFEVSWTTLLIYGVLSGICMPLFELPFHTIALNNISDHDQKGKLRMELVVAREAALSIGRISSVLMLYAIYNIDGHSQIYIQGFIILVVLIGLLPHLFLRSVSRGITQ